MLDMNHNADVHNEYTEIMTEMYDVSGIEIIEETERRRVFMCLRVCSANEQSI